MPQMEVAYLTDWVVLWEATGIDDDGEVTIGAPVEVRARWVDGRAETVDRKGDPIALDALAVVAQPVPDGSLLWLGTLEDWYGTGSAGAGVGLHQVKTASRTPDLKGRGQRRTLGLQRFKDRLPGAT